ncbi:MAG: hydrolase [Defluviitaleaceae bacterium]|nr:hydrolase [Defluviitaleaceae bacterium]
MDRHPNGNEARELLALYNKEDFHIRHAETVSGVMGWFARAHDPENEGYWRAVGYLHDIDFEMYPDEHCVKGEELLREAGAGDMFVRSAMSHGYGPTATPHEPQNFMEKILYAADELTGLIWAAALMRPSKSVSDIEVPSVMKKFKDKRFAAGCSRETILAGAEMLGWPIEKLVGETITAMRECE